MSNTPFVTHFKALQARWTCSQHPHHCYVDPATQGHFKLDSRDLGDWATAMLNGCAALVCPPRTAEFNALLNGKRNSTKKGNFTPSESSHGAIVQNFYNYQPQGDSTPSKPSIVTSSNAAVTPLRGISPAEYSDSALRQFLAFLEARFNDGKFNEAFNILQANDIGVDHIRDAGKSSKDKKEIIQMLMDVGLSPGLSWRIVKGFNDWRASISTE